MHRKKIVHIYYNTSGNSGLYLNPIKDALDSRYEQIFFVNYYYPLNLEPFNRCFFRLTERNENNPNKVILKHKYLRKIVRYIELKLANLKMLRFLRRQKPDAINYSLTNMPDALTFLRNIKKACPNGKIIVTCHDVVPFRSTDKIDYQSIYDFADFLLVHTANAVALLKNQYGISEKKIVYHPFPLIDLSLLEPSNVPERRNRNVPRFLFIGVMREEKGVQILINAWKELGPDFPAKLYIAGFKPDDVKIDVDSIIDFPNFKIAIKSLSDKEYVEAVHGTDYVVFPYTQVGNSGVLSTVISLGKIPVTTKLSTFQESQYYLDELSCKPNDVLALAKLLKHISLMHKTKFDQYVRNITYRRAKSKATFQQSVLAAYENMLN